MDTSGIRWVTVSDENNILTWLCGAHGLIHGSNSGLNTSVIGDVISSDCKVFRRNKEEDIMMFTHNFDIGFITCAYRIDVAFMLDIEAMAVESSSSGIIEDRLIRDVDIKYRPHDESSFSGATSKGYIESKNKAEDI